MKRLLFTLMALAMVFATSCSDDDDSSGGGSYYYGSVTATLPSGEGYIAGGTEGDILKGKRFSEGESSYGYKWTFSNDGKVKRIANGLNEGSNESVTGSASAVGDEPGYEYRYTLSSDKTKIYLQVIRTIALIINRDNEDDEGHRSATYKWCTFSQALGESNLGNEETCHWGTYNQIRPYELTVTPTEGEITSLTLTAICEEGFSLVDGHFSGRFRSDFGSDYSISIKCGWVCIEDEDNDEFYDTLFVGPFNDSVFTVTGGDEESDEYTTISVPYTTSGSGSSAKVSFTFKGTDYEATYSNSNENITLNKASE